MATTPNTLNQRLAKEAAPLITLYKKRVDPKRNYYKRVRSCLATLTKASQWVDAAAWDLSQCALDREHTSQIDAICGSTTELFGDLAAFREKLPAFGRSIAYMAGTISFCTAVPLKAKKGRRPLKYLSETKEFIQVYEKVTGKQIPFPKGTSKGVAVQHSTHFIASCLRRIDPTFNASSAITNIIKVLQQRKNSFDFG